MTQKAVAETIRICKDRDILKEYLHGREKEVVTIMMSLFDEEQIMKTYWKDMRNTLTQELTQELKQELTQELSYEKDRETAEKLIKMGKLSLEEIALCVPSLSLDELREIEAEIMQLA